MAYQDLNYLDRDFYTLYGDLRSLELTGHVSLPCSDLFLAPLNWDLITSVCQPVLEDAKFCGVQCSDLFPVPPTKIKHEDPDHPIVGLIQDVHLESVEILSRTRQNNSQLSNISNLSMASQDRAPILPDGNYWPPPLRTSTSLPFMNSSGGEGGRPLSESNNYERSFNVRRWTMVSPIVSHCLNGNNNSSMKRHHEDFSFNSSVGLDDATKSVSFNGSKQFPERAISRHHSMGSIFELKKHHNTSSTCNTPDVTFAQPAPPRGPFSRASTLVASTPIHSDQEVERRRDSSSQMRHSSSLKKLR